MMKAIGIESLEALFADIPEKYRLKKLLELPPPLSEQEIWGHMSNLAARNRLPKATLLGAGAYHHYIPAVVGHIIGRSEFYTAYTPYQAEISQGILQAIYEYQTMITRLTGTQVANASMYDGATAMAEAAVLSAKTLGKTRLLLARSIHPEYRRGREDLRLGERLRLRRDPLRSLGSGRRRGAPGSSRQGNGCRLRPEPQLLRRHRGREAPGRSGSRASSRFSWRASRTPPRSES